MNVERPSNNARRSPECNNQVTEDQLKGTGHSLCILPYIMFTKNLLKQFTKTISAMAMNHS